MVFVVPEMVINGFCGSENGYLWFLWFRKWSLVVSCGFELVSVGFGVGGSGSCGFGMVIAVSKMVIACSKLVIANMRMMKTTLEPNMWSVISVLRFTQPCDPE